MKAAVLRKYIKTVQFNINYNFIDNKTLSLFPFHRYEIIF